MLKRLFALLAVVAALSTGSPAHAQYKWILGGTGDASCTVPLVNDTVTGTLQNKFVTLTGAGHAINATTGTTTGIVGVCIGGCGMTGTASVQICGIAGVVFDSGGVTQDTYVIPSTTIAGAGLSSNSTTIPTTVESMGEIVSPTTAGAGTYFVLLWRNEPTGSSGGGGGGSGTVTSVGLSAPGIFTVSGSPVTGAGTLAFSLNTENAVTVFAGPVAGSSAAAPTFRVLGATDIPGVSTQYPNDSGTGTTLNKLVKLTSANPSTVIINAAGDTTDSIGICASGCGTTGTATIVQYGTATCAFDGSTTAGDYVQISASVAGDCTDAGATFPVANGQVLGHVNATNSGAGAYSMNIFSPDVVASGGSGKNPYDIGYDYVGTVSASGIVAFTTVREIFLPANLSGSTATCGTAPGSTDVFSLKDNASQIATISLNSSCVATLATTGGLAQTVLANHRLEIDAPGTVHSEADVAITLKATR